jgi:hypothetical protein
MGSTQLFGAWLAALAECVQELRERVASSKRSTNHDKLARPR